MVARSLDGSSQVFVNISCENISNIVATGRHPLVYFEVFFIA